MSAWMPQKYIASENRIQFHTHTHQVIGSITSPLQNRFLGSDAQNWRKNEDRAYSSIGFLFLLSDDCSAHTASRELRLLSGQCCHPNSAHFEALWRFCYHPALWEIEPGRLLAQSRKRPLSHMLSSSLEILTLRGIPRECLTPWLLLTENSTSFFFFFPEMPVLTTSPRHGNSFIQRMLTENPSCFALAECRSLVHVVVSPHFFLPQVHSRCLIVF